MLVISRMFCAYNNLSMNAIILNFLLGSSYLGNPNSTVLHTAGLLHIGCYFVPQFSDMIGLLEGTTADLSDDPVTRTEPIRKCGMGAQQRDYQFFAISVGYCISGSTQVADYTSERSSNLCNDGVGAYFRGHFLMDVYEILDKNAFLDSVSQITATTVVLPPATTAAGSEDVDLTDSSGATSFNASFMLLLCLMVFIVLCIIL